MKKNPNVLTHTEIICLAIKALQKDCEEAHRQLQKFKETNEEMYSMLASSYEATFWKFEKLLDLYEMETGTAYDHDFEFLE